MYGLQPYVFTPYGMAQPLEPAVVATNVRALLIKMGLIHQITDAEIGTSLKPLVLLEGQLKQRVATEGVPVIYDPAIAGLRTLASNETLQI